MIEWGRVLCEAALYFFLAVAAVEYIGAETSIGFFASLPDENLLYLTHPYVWLVVAVAGSFGFISLGYRMWSGIDFGDRDTRKREESSGVR